MDALADKDFGLIAETTSFLFYFSGLSDVR